MKNQELIKHLNRIKKYIKENLEMSSIYLCTMHTDLDIALNGKLNKKYLKLLKANKPTPKLHPSFYNHRNFNKDTDSYVWWKMPRNKTRSTLYRLEINTQRLLFIKRLKEQLEEDIITI